MDVRRMLVFRCVIGSHYTCNKYFTVVKGVVHFKKKKNFC